jgi:hypothetical protein
LESYYKGIVSDEEMATLREESQAKGVAICDALMDKAGWPEVPLDGKLLVSHQDALLVGGKVQAPAGYAFARLAWRKFALTDALDRPLPPTRPVVCHYLIMKNASIAVPACGIAPRRIPVTRN